MAGRTSGVGPEALDLPDTVFALGEAGREMVREPITSGWFLREVMREDPGEHSSFDVYLIDSATGEAPEVSNLIDGFEETREREAPDRTAGIIYPTVQEINVLRNSQYSTREDLISRETVGEIIMETGYGHWWLEDSKDFVPDDKDFATGAVRRRALSKAYYFGSKASTNDLENAINQVGSDVAIVVGLGGGTGSGLFIDLARDIARAHSGIDITLFAVLPHSKEPGERRANAMAALSELEFLSLTGENPFENVVLLPFEPVREGNMTNTRWAKEFDEAFTTVLTGYYTSDSDDRKTLLRKTPSYAPFTVAVPRVLRYNIDAINEIEADLEEFVEEKRKAIEFEQELYEGIVDDLLLGLSDQIARAEAEGGQIYIDGEQVNNSLVEPSERARLNERLEDVEALINLEVFNQLEYQFVEVFQRLFNEARAEDARETVDNLELELESRLPTSEMDDDREKTDREMAKALEMEVEALVRRKQLIQYSNLLNDDLMSGAVDFLIGNYGPNDRTVDLGQLTDRRNEERGKRIQAEEDLETAREELESAEEQIQTVLEEWSRAVRTDVETLVSLESEREVLVEEAETLDQQLRQVADRVSGATTRNEVQPAEVEFDFTGFADQLASYGLESPGFDRETVEDAVENLKRAQELRLEDTGRGGIIGFLKRLIEGSDGEENRDVYDRIVEQLRAQDPQVFSVSDWSDDFLRVTVTLDARSTVSERLDERRDELVEEIMQPLQAAVEDADVDAAEHLDAERIVADVDLDSTSDPQARLRSAVKDRLEEEIVGNLQNRVETLETEFEEAKASEERFDDAIETFTVWQQAGDLAARLEEIREWTNDLGERDIDETDTDYRYIRRIQHDSIHDALNKSDIADSSILDPSSTERDKVERELKRLARSAVGEKQYLMLREMSIDAEGADSKRGYGGMGLSTVFMSRAFDNSFNESSIRQEIRRSMYIGDPSNQDMSEVVSNGHPWEVGMATFITGVFLDNIENAAQQRDGYHAEYSDWEQIYPDSVPTRHSYGLAGEDRSRFSEGTDHGLRIVRQDLLNMNDAEELDLFINAGEDEITGRLFDCMEVESYVADHPYNIDTIDVDE